jgi:hypothetical protein
MLETFGIFEVAEVRQAVLPLVWSAIGRCRQDCDEYAWEDPLHGLSGSNCEMLHETILA